MHTVKKPKRINRFTRSFNQALAAVNQPVNIKPAYSLWFAAGLYKHLKGQSYVKVQRSIVQA